MPENRHWTVCNECGDKNDDLHGKEVKDIIAALFFNKDFKSKNDWSIENPESPTVFLPTFKIKSKLGTIVNKDFLNNKNLLINAAKNKKESIKKEYFEIMFSAFAHPLIYLEYERYILLTNFKARHSQIIKRKKHPKGTIEEKVLNITFKHMFKAFCKMRTKFIKCHGETIKPAFFCEGPFSKLYGPKNKIVKLVQKLGYPTLTRDLKNYEGNKGITPSTTSKKLYIKKNELTIEEELKNATNHATTLKYIKKIDDETKEKTQEPEDTKNEDGGVSLNEALSGHLEENEFGRTNAKRAVSSVLKLWKKGQKKDAVTLFKMFKDTTKRKSNYTSLINTMYSSRLLF